MTMTFEDRVYIILILNTLAIIIIGLLAFSHEMSNNPNIQENASSSCPIPQNFSSIEKNITDAAYLQGFNDGGLSLSLDLWNGTQNCKSFGIEIPSGYVTITYALQRYGCCTSSNQTRK